MNMKSTNMLFATILALTSGMALQSGPLHTSEANTQLFKAVLQNDVPAAKNALKNGAQVNNKLYDHGHATPLHCAATFGHTEVARLLLDNGANINITADSNTTALQLAALQGHVPMVQLLVKRGANVNSQNTDGMTALIAATYQNNLPMVQCLVTHNADVNLQDNNGATALDFAKQDSNVAIINYLQAHGAR